MAVNRMKCDAYLDIETTGLSRFYADLTVIGVAVGRGAGLYIEQLVGSEIAAERLLELLQGVDEIYTYNGSRFDLPFIEGKLKVDLKRCFRHTDLMYECWRRQLKGGLKVVEQKLGIGRRLEGVNGYIAVQLWWRYVNHHDERALATLLAYNREDVLNLRVLRERLGMGECTGVVGRGALVQVR